MVEVRLIILLTLKILDLLNLVVDLLFLTFHKGKLQYFAFEQTGSGGSDFDQYGLSGFTFKADGFLDPVIKDHCSLVDRCLNLLFAMLVRFSCSWC